MIPFEVIHYLKHHSKPFRLLAHPHAETAQELAHSLHVSGRRIAKSVVVSADGRPWLALLPAQLRVDEQRLAELLDAKQVTLMPETSCTELFPNCEVGAEPPFGHLYNVPVVLDGSLRNEGWVICRGGSHEEALEVRCEDLISLEHPIIGAFAYAPTGPRDHPWELMV